MKNVETGQLRGVFFRVPVKGAPPLGGWAVRYLSGMEEVGDVKPGYWLSLWHVGAEYLDFRFEPEAHMSFQEEEQARKASRLLREVTEIQTEVLKLDPPNIGARQ